MAEIQDSRDVGQVEQRVEEKELELVNHDEFGELITGDVQRSQEHQESQENRMNNQEQADDMNQQPPNLGNSIQVHVGNRTDPPANMQLSIPNENSRANQDGNSAFRSRGGQSNGSSLEVLEVVEEVALKEYTAIIKEVMMALEDTEDIMNIKGGSTMDRTMELENDNLISIGYPRFST